MPERHCSVCAKTGHDKRNCKTARAKKLWENKPVKAKPVKEPVKEEKTVQEHFATVKSIIGEPVKCDPDNFDKVVEEQCAKKPGLKKAFDDLDRHVEILCKNHLDDMKKNKPEDYKKLMDMLGQVMPKKRFARRR